MCHTELHLQTEGPSLTVTGITPLFCVQCLFGVFFPLMVGFIPGWQVSMVLYWFLLHCDLSKGWISCSNRYKKQGLSVAWFCKAPIPKQAALMDSHSACCGRGGGWDCVAWRGVSHVHKARCDLFRVVKCWASGLPIKMAMGEGGKNKDQCLRLVHITNFSLGIWMTFLC